MSPNLIVQGVIPYYCSSDLPLICGIIYPGYIYWSVLIDWSIKIEEIGLACSLCYWVPGIFTIYEFLIIALYNYYIKPILLPNLQDIKFFKISGR